MIWQFMIVGTIVSTALTISIIRVINFFRLPPSKCGGCSGCKLGELKAGMKG